MNPYIYFLLFNIILLDGAFGNYKDQNKYNGCNDVLEWKDCKFYKSIGYCVQRAEKLLELCPRTCNLCDSLKVKENTCSDKDGPIDCNYLKNQGACLTHEALMIERCSKTCSLCDAKSKCDMLKCPKNKVCVVDKTTNEAKCECPTFCLYKNEYKKLGVVCATNGITYKDYCDLLYSNCQDEHNATVAFYGTCPADEPCEDSEQEKKSGFCDTWKNMGLCENDKNTMKTYCSRTCKLCPEKKALSPQHILFDGQCWDKTPKSLSSSSKECNACKDRFPELCVKFIQDCNSSFKNAQRFMKLNCPAICGYCLSDHTKIGIKIFSHSGKKLTKTYSKLLNT